MKRLWKRIRKKKYVIPEEDVKPIENAWIPDVKIVKKEKSLDERLISTPTPKTSPELTPIQSMGKKKSSLKIIIDGKIDEDDDYIMNMLGRNIYNILNTSLHGVVITNEDGIMIYMNDKILDLFGYQKRELMFKNINILLPKSFHDKHNEYIRDNKKKDKDEKSNILNKVRKMYAIDNDGKKVEIEIRLSKIDKFFVCNICDMRQMTIYANSLKHMHKNDELLRGIIDSVIPKFLISNVMKGERDLSFYHDDIIIGFFDIKDYTKQSADTSIFPLLKLLYGHIDVLCKRHNVIKVEIVGDAVMVASNMFYSARRDTTHTELQEYDDDDFLTYVDKKRGSEDIFETPTTAKRDAMEKLMMSHSSFGTSTNTLQTMHESPNSPISPSSMNWSSNRSPNLFDRRTSLMNTSNTIQVEQDIDDMINFLIDCIGFGLDFELQLRCGIHRGRAISGLVGTDQFRYHIFGDAVNVAARMEGLASPTTVCITEDAKNTIRNINNFTITDDGEQDVKGKGMMRTFTIHTVFNKSQ